MGATNPAQAAPGTIRADLGIDTGRNLVHGSDSLESAEKEIRLFFQEGEMFSYERSIDPWVFE
jgi:nucleoside-diphosphate kinase